MVRGTWHFDFEKQNLGKSAKCIRLVMISSIIQNFCELNHTIILMRDGKLSSGKSGSPKELASSDFSVEAQDNNCDMLQ